MNAGIYRLMFSAVRRMLVPVDEHASMRDVSSEPCIGQRGPGVISWLAVRASVLAALCVLGAHPLAAEAQATLPMTPDRSGPSHPVVGVSSSGVPLVNIVAPNSAGVSLNNFTHYNVGPTGAVIVNTPRGAHTQIAGWVRGNPLMGNAPARLIVNQVTSGNPTRLLGVTEIAGARANLVIANPAGIACAGCGFINIPRVSLATARPGFNVDGSLAGFDVTRGRLDIDGLGLDARGSAIDLIARAMQINADVWAESIKATAGANQVGYESGVTVLQAGQGEQPGIAIDVRALGGMYANSVRLIGTEAGVGVRMAGVITSLTGDIELSSNGNVVIAARGRVQSAGGVRVNALAVKNEGTVVSRQSARFDAQRLFRNDGVVASLSNINVSAPNLSNNGSVVAGVDADGGLSGPGSVTLAGKLISSGGSLAAGDNVNVSGTTVSLDSGSIFAASALNLSADQSLTTRGTTATAINGTLRSGGAYINDDGAVETVADTRIDARLFSNREGLVTGRTLTVAVDELDNIGGDMVARGRAQVSSANLTNDGGRIGSMIDALRLSATSRVSNVGGRITAADTLTVQADRVENTSGIALGDAIEMKVHGAIANRNGRIAASKMAQVDSETLDNQGGAIGTVIGALAIETGNAIDNERGKLLAGGDVRLSSAGLINADGKVSGENVSLNSVGGHVDNTRGVIDAASRLDSDTASFGNRSGLIQAGGFARIDTHAGQFENGTADGATTGGKLAGNGVSLAAGVIQNTAGRIVSSDSLRVSAHSVTNEGGAILSHRALGLDSAGEISNVSGRIGGDSDVIVTGTRIDNTRGKIHGGEAVDLSAGTLANDGRIESRGDATVKASDSLTNSGAIIAGNDLRAVSQGNLTNRGTMAAQNVARVSGLQIDNESGAEITGNRGAHVRAALSVKNRGLIDGGAARIVATDSVENHGRIFGDSISISAQFVRNAADAQAVGAAIGSRGDVDIGAPIIENLGDSLIYASNDIRTGRDLDADGRASDARSERFTNNGSLIDAAGNVTIRANRFENLNANFQTKKVTTDAGRRVWYTTNGATERIDPPDVYLYHRNSHEVRDGANYGWALDDDDQKVLLLSSPRYPFAEYAKYTLNGVAGKIDAVHYPSAAQLIVGEYATERDGSPVEIFRSVPDGLWAAFGVAPPPSPPDPAYIETGNFAAHRWTQRRELGADWYSIDAPIAHAPQARDPQGHPESCVTAAADHCAPFKQWYGKLSEAYAAIGKAVNDYNGDVASRAAERWTVYDVDVKSTKDVVATTQPGRILAGRGVTVDAESGINDKSQILAGGRAYFNDAIQDNSQPKGVETFTGSGRAVTTWVESGGAFRGDKRKHASQPYMAPIPQREIDLPVSIAAPGHRDLVKRVEANASAALGVSDKRVSEPNRLALDERVSANVEVFAVGGVETDARRAALMTNRSPADAPARAKSGAMQVRTVEPNIELPSNALYRVVRDPGSRHLIETDARFINDKQWLSSERMVAALNSGSASVQKRLGDGFYEQQLIQRQIVEATGHRFIGGYADNQTQYQALMANGLKYAQRFDMNVGTALTDAQMAALTDDIVWLVNREVTLADGTRQTVLAPQVYLRAHEADVTGTGAIIAGENVVLSNTGVLANSGAIASRRMTIITADSITNVGAVAGQTVQAEAKHDLANVGGTIQGDAVVLSAGRDVSLTSTTSGVTTSNGAGTVIDRAATINAGALSVQAGRDLNMKAAQIVAAGETSLSARRDISLGAIGQMSQSHVQWGEKNLTARTVSADTGTVIRSGSHLELLAGRDLSAAAAELTAGGRLRGWAGRDIKLSAGQQSASAYDEHYVSERGVLSSKSTHAIDASSYTDAIGSTLSSDTVELVAGGNLTADAVTIAGTGDVGLAAGRDLRISTAETATSEYHFRDVRKAGLGSAGAGISHGANQATDASRDVVKGSKGSLIGSIGGSVSLRAGNRLHVTGSDIVAAKDVEGIAKEVTIDASQTDRHHHETHETKSSGFTLAVKSPVLDTIQNMNRQARGAARSQDGRAAALHAMAAAGSLADVAGAAGDMAGALGTGQSPEAKVELSFGSSRSKSALTEDSTWNNGSTVNAGGRAAFAATGEKDAGQGNVTIVGSDVLAKDVFLKARNRVDLFNSTDTDKTRSTNESSSASVGVSFGTNGWGVSAAMSRAHGNANSDAATRNNSHIAASKTATIISGGDTNIVGATIDATRVLADIGGDLNIASVQDTVRSAAHQSSAGGGFSVSQGGGSASVSVSSRHASGSYAGVREQSGIRAAGGGFDIAVKGNTDLKGAYIASNAAPDKNRLATGTLSFSDVRNSSSYDATSIGMSAGGSFGDGGNNYATHGATTGSNAGGGVPATVGESGASAALTKSAISTSHITILDEANQRQDIGLLSRDATDLNGGVDKLPDLTTVLNEQADLIDGAQGAAEVVAKQIGAYADKKREESLKVAAEESDPVFKADYQRQAESWAEGGTRRAAMHMAGGALTGGFSGGGGGAIGGAVGAGASAIMAPQLEEIARSISEAEPTSSRNLNELLGNVTSNVLAGSAGALTGGSTGRGAGAAVDRFNRQLNEDDREQRKELAALSKEKGLPYSEGDIANQQALMDLRVGGKAYYGDNQVATGEKPQDGTDWSYYRQNVKGESVWVQNVQRGDPELQAFIANNTNGETANGMTYEATTFGSNPGLFRMPDFVNFQVDYLVGSAWGTFTRDGNSYFGYGLNKGIPNSVGAGVSISGGYLNTMTVRPGQTNKFAEGYAGGGAALYGGVGAGVMVSPGNGTATVIGVGAGTTLGKTKNPATVGGGFSVDQGKTGAEW